MINKKGEKGLTYIEVLIALIVIIVAISAFSYLFQYSFYMLFDAGRSLEGVYGNVKKTVENYIHEKDIEELEEKFKVNEGNVKLNFNDKEDVEIKGNTFELEIEYDTGQYQKIEFFKKENEED